MPSFTEEALPRVLTFDSDVTDTNIKSWFPLSPSSGLSFNFAVIHGNEPARPFGLAELASGRRKFLAEADLAAIRHLDWEVYFARSQIAVFC